MEIKCTKRGRNNLAEIQPVRQQTLHDRFKFPSMSQVIRRFASSADTKPRVKSSRTDSSRGVKIPTSGRQAATNKTGKPFAQTSPKH